MHATLSSSKSKLVYKSYLKSSLPVHLEAPKTKIPIVVNHLLNDTLPWLRGASHPVLTLCQCAICSRVLRTFLALQRGTEFLILEWAVVHSMYILDGRQLNALDRDRLPYENRSGFYLGII